MSKSSLATITKLSSNHSGKRTHSIDTITPHCFVGQVTASKGLDVFLPISRKASANYVIGHDGQIGCCVDEDNRSWCTSSRENDQRAITIEVASDTRSPYAFTPAAYDSLIKLCVDICKRYNKTKLVWKNDKNFMLNYVPKDNEMRITVHRWFAAKSCPGEWLMNKMDAFVDEVNAQLNAHKPNSVTYYKVQIGAYKVKENAEKALDKAISKGYADAFVTKVGDLYKIQLGAFLDKNNALEFKKSIKANGYKDSFIVEVKHGSFNA